MFKMARITPPTALPLRDIHLPAAVSWWPPALGWWLLIALAALLTAALLLGRHLWCRRRMRRLALNQLEELRSLGGPELVVSLSRLLRQAAILHFTAEPIAGLQGKAWLEFLDRPFSDAPFSCGVGRCLADGPYRPDCEIDKPPLLHLCRSWLKKLPPQPLSARRPR
jgi:hypothetical protein